jgi:hypothetical protein
MKAIFFLTLGFLGAGSAWAVGPGILGDDNPYPLACISFAGDWRSDNYEFLEIEQNGCEWLQIRALVGQNGGSTTTIVPDDKDRAISGAQWTGLVRHRWNSKTNATIIETHREMNYSDKRVEELVLLEKVNPDLLLESTYRTTKMRPRGKEDCPPQQETSQRMFRLVDKLSR